MFTADQIVAHLVGDYLLQSHWMATEKTRNSLAAAVHALVYACCFIPITGLGPAAAFAWLGILIPHFFIDRFRLARFVVWAKNGAHGPVTATGYPDDVPPWLSVWLLIIADNTIHLITNGVVLALIGGRP